MQGPPEYIDVYASGSAENTWRGVGKKRPQKEELVRAAFSAAAYYRSGDVLEIAGYHRVHHGNSDRATLAGMDAMLTALSEESEETRQRIRARLNSDNLNALRRTMGKVKIGKYHGIEEVIPRHITGNHALLLPRYEESRAVRLEAERRLSTPATHANERRAA